MKIVEYIYIFSLFFDHSFFRVRLAPGGGGLPYATDGDARRLAYGCQFWILVFFDFGGEERVTSLRTSAWEAKGKVASCLSFIHFFVLITKVLEEPFLEWLFCARLKLLGSKSGESQKAVKVSSFSFFHLLLFTISHLPEKI